MQQSDSSQTLDAITSTLDTGYYSCDVRIFGHYPSQAIIDATMTQDNAITTIREFMQDYKDYPVRYSVQNTFDLPENDYLDLSDAYDNMPPVWIIDAEILNTSDRQFNWKIRIDAW